MSSAILPPSETITPDGEIRRAPASVGRPVDVDRVTDLILAAAREASGVTIGASGTLYTGDGILVGLPEHGADTFPAFTGDDSVRDFVRAWVASAAPAVARNASPRRFFGAWVDPRFGTLHLDVAEAFSSAEEDLAMRAAERRGQLAAWHAGRRECLHVDTWRRWGAVA